MSNIEKIKAYIERQRGFIEGLFIEGDNNFYDGQDDAYNHLLAFIDSLPEEKPSEDLVEADELKNLIMRVCGYKKDHDQSLEEAALWNYYGGGYVPKNQELRDAALKTKEVQSFIAGAEWQKSHLTVEDIKTILDLSFWNDDPEKILEEYNRICDTSKVTRR